MPLTGLLGHQKVYDALRRELSQRPGHGYLFFGPRGIGKELVAEALTLGLLCERGNEGEFCCELGACPQRRPEQARSAAEPRAKGGSRAASDSGNCDCCAACVQLARRVHPDFEYVTRPANRIAVLIEQVRELIARMGSKPARGLRRVAIIDEAETLQAAAQNALLKTLEEPPGHAIIFLIAQSDTALLDTIRSRLRSVRFLPIGRPELSAWLAGRHGLEPVRAGALAELARGSVARALELMAGEAPPVEELWRALARARQMDFLLAGELAERYFANREQAADNFELLARMAEQMMCAKLLAAGAESELEPSPPEMRDVAQALSLSEILIILEQAVHAGQAVAAMANPRLQAEGFFMTLGDQLASAPERHRR